MYFFIDESGFDEKSIIFLVGLVILDKPDIVINKITKLKEDILHDPILVKIRTVKQLKSRGFHYCEDHFEVRNKLIDLMSTLTFQAYICFVEKNKLKDRERQETYRQLIRKLLYDRVRGNMEVKIHICLEKTIEKEQNIVEIIKDVVKDIIKRGKKPISHFPEVTFSGKEEACLSVVDYVCGIFRSHYENLYKEDNFERRNFDRIRWKIRVIHNLLSDEFYTRRNPFP